MAARTRRRIKMGKPQPGQDVCAAPPHRNGTNLMDIHPVDMRCYEGK